ncbi:repulsive guidance molecule A-like isoform X2 [Amblyraja radiata]|uniref:repulsive guidance molecule A-like isoform X2 n=1 Tax=Amblyraja radiata TaxID=386614 RepID=UPI0014026466|nr:repulsive guidance molecule A-like isoform X2 [Amblyraja radiata]
MWSLARPQCSSVVKRVVHFAEQSTDSSRAGWIGMGKGRRYPLAKKLCSSVFAMLIFSMCLNSVRCQQCRIQRCNAEFVAATSPGIGLQEESEGGGGGNGGDFCIALRAYSQCTKKTAKYCRGDLVYHSAVLGINDLMAQHNCSKTGPTAPVKPSGTERSRLPELCSYQGRVNSLSDGGQQQPPKFAHCGLFGDPHLRTFRDEFQTCKVEGAWPLIDSDYLSVQVTNVPVVRDSSATATSKITIIFKSFHGCTEQKVYQATTEGLPSAFVDGTRSGSEREGGGSLRILERVGSGQVEIQARYIATTIIVRQVGKYLTFAIRVPEETLNYGDESVCLQLCLHGCPRSELIKEHTLSRRLGDTRLPGPRQVYTVESATSKCRQILQVEDVYFQSCVFDLLTTGDPAFSMAAHGALEDLKALHVNVLKQHTSPRTAAGRNGTPACHPPHLIYLASLLLITTFM